MTASMAARLLDQLAAAGVACVFTCPGTTEVPVLDAAVGREGPPRLVLATHEAAAMSMADGYARASGTLGVALLHANVGLVNGLSMMEAARVGRSGVLVLNGIKPLALANERAFTMTRDVLQVVAPFTRSAATVASSDRLDTDLATAICAALPPSPGPVYLGLPQDVLAAPGPADTAPPQMLPPQAGVPGGAVDAVAHMLGAAPAVVLVAGSDLARGGVTELLSLADRLDAPVCEAPWRELERQTVPTDHPRYAGVLSDVADIPDGAVIVLVGTPPLQVPEPGAALIPPETPVVHLVEHDDHLGGARSGPTHALVGDLPGTLQALDDAIAAGGETHSVVHERRHQATTTLVDAHWRRQQALFDSDIDADAPLTTSTLMQQLRSCLSNSSPMVVDAVTATSCLLQVLPRGQGDDFFATGSGALGWGMGAGVGVAIARPHQRTVAIVSDGVFQFNLQALSTAVAEQSPVSFVIVNNRAYHAVRLALGRYDRVAARTATYPGTDLPNADLAQVARGLGTFAVTVGTGQELVDAMSEAHDGPVVIDCIVTADTRNPIQ